MILPVGGLPSAHPHIASVAHVPAFLLKVALPWAAPGEGEPAFLIGKVALPLGCPWGRPRGGKPATEMILTTHTTRTTTQPTAPRPLESCKLSLRPVEKSI